MLNHDLPQMKQHPLSAAFPAMSAEQFQVLKDSIMDIGVQEPITLFQGMVIDGWHRYTAAYEMNMDCPTVDLGDVDPQSFVVAKNKARRHITTSQIATAVVAVYQWRPLGANQHGGSAPGADPKSTKQLAEIAGVGTRTIEQAKTVESKATPAIKAAVKSGLMSVKKAAETINPPKAKAAVASQPAAAATHSPLPEDEARFDPLEELEAANVEITKLRKLCETDDKTAEALRMYGVGDVLQRRNDEHLATIALRNRHIAFLTHQLDRCGKAVGELDHDKIAPAVEAMARTAKGEK